MKASDVLIAVERLFMRYGAATEKALDATLNFRAFGRTSSLVPDDRGFFSDSDSNSHIDHSPLVCTIRQCVDFESYILYLILGQCI